MDTNVSEEHAVSIFRAEISVALEALQPDPSAGLYIVVTSPVFARDEILTYGDSLAFYTVQHFLSEEKS
jgi:hypothetical protein